jgi:DNA-binding MarR family transcriptional regulator
MTVNPEEAASELLEVVPMVMREIRSMMRSQGSSDLTVPQFRTLAFVNRNQGSPLCKVADHMGLTSASASTLVDGLIKRGMMTREDQPDNRRRVRLVVTSRGKAILETSRRGTMTILAKKLSSVSADNREVIVKAMETLRSVFGSSAPQGV